ncbi:hypothetical protein [Blastopirellula marina]|uniref:Glycosyltransferase RgtA/B/C/D-like domain-containing protein n=1 Tax=Blastopirellula marina TaxID=124 RepID=A0A2S8GGT4_9BACT|nr:hypothetical protein [Blastopirellula marina]PQO43666.1 hypothetical protein C5Y93_23805 [Blastopirellula marina]
MSVEMSSENKLAATGGVVATAKAWLKSPVFWSICLYGCAIVALYLRLASHPYHCGVFNSDSLFPLHVAKDILVDGSSLRGWTFCPSPFVFPDAAVAGFFYLLTGQAIISSFLTGVFFVTMTALGFSYCGRLTGLGDAKTRICLTLLAASGYLMYIAYDVEYVPHHVLFMAAYHSGAFMCMIWSVGLMLAAFQAKPGTAKRYRLLCGFGALVFLTAMGDPLILPMLVAPATVAAVACWFMRYLRHRQLYAPLFLLWSCSFGGIYAIRRLITISPATVVGSPGLKRSLIAAKNLIGFFLEELMRGDLVHWFGILWFVACCVMVYLAFKSPKLSAEESEPIAPGGRIAFVYGYFLMSMLAMFSAPVAVGHARLVDVPLSYEYVLHYCHPFLIGPVFGLPLVIAAAFRHFRLPQPVQDWAGPIATIPAAVFLGVMVTQINVNQLDIGLQRTQFVAQLDEILAKHHLRKGVTEYWKCRHIATMSQSGVKIIPIMPVDMRYLGWMNNSRHLRYNDIDSDNYIPYDFIVTSPIDGLTREDVIERFGPPAHIEEVRALGIPQAETDDAGMCIGVEVMVYNRPEDVRFQQFFESPFKFPGYSRTIPGAELPSEIGKIEQEDRVAESDGNSAGFVTFGPYVKLPAGEYSVAVELDADGEADASVGVWDVLLSNETTRASKTLADGKIAAGQKEVRYEFTVDQEHDDNLMEARIRLSGKGRIAVKSIELQRLR